MRLNYKSEKGCVRGDKCHFRHVEAEGKPHRRSRKGGAKGSVAILKESFQLGCVSQDSYPRKSILREPGRLESKHAVKFSKRTWHQIKIRERKGASRGIIQKCARHERSPCAPKIGEGSWRDFAPREMRPQCSVGFGEHISKLKNSDKTAFFAPVAAKVMPAPTSKRPEREFVVDSGATLHTMSKKASSSEEMDRVKRSRTSTVVLTANGELHTHEEARVFVHDLNLFVTVQVLEETHAVLSLGKLWEDHGYSHEWVSGQKPRLTKDGKSVICKTDNFVPLVVPGLSTNPESGSSSTSPSQDLLRRVADRASRELVRPASSSSPS